MEGWCADCSVAWVCCQHVLTPGVCRNAAAAACSFIKNSSLVKARLAIRWTHMVSNKLVTDGGRRFLEDVQ
ncbi:hypothetical protein V6N11_017347 [Hibiscus sabdariffa]|uniref:Uncharacterized protein n=1 Tax=Hibiscus sabdariffa TaxID=183260 RepID=A0ABR2TXR3_9ROSI